MLNFSAMRSATSKKTTPPTSHSISRIERAVARPKAVTIRPLKRGGFTEKEFDAIALAHGARPLTAAERRNLPRIAGKQAD